MAQEDRGLVIRGLVLLALIGALVTFVVALLFWRPEEVPPPLEQPAETFIPTLLASGSGVGYPAEVPWYAIHILGNAMPSAPGWNIRYNAAATMARKGYASVPWPLIREMLDEKLQMRNNRVRMPDGREVYDESAARSNIIITLKALAAWHEKQTAESKKAFPPELRQVYVVVDKLAESPIAELKLQAEKARATFFR